MGAVSTVGEGLLSPMPKVRFRISRLRLRSGGSSVGAASSGLGFCVSLVEWMQRDLEGCKLEFLDQLERGCELGPREKGNKWPLTV